MAEGFNTDGMLDMFLYESGQLLEKLENIVLEKKDEENSWINGGFMVCEPEVFDYIEPNNDNVVFEKDPLEKLASDNQLNAYKYYGFWKSMDTMKCKNDLNEKWQNKNAPWKIW